MNGISFGGTTATVTVASKNPNALKLEVNNQIGPGHLHFSTNTELRIFLNSINDIPLKDQNSKWEVTSYGTQYVRFKVNEIDNDPLLYQIPVKRRRCRFREEKPSNFLLYDVYSYSTCMDECRLRKILQYCGCVPHIYYETVNGNYTMCTVEQGLVCIAKKYKSISEPENDGFKCDCMTGCTEDDIIITYAGFDIFSLSNQQQKVDIEIIMETLPHERFKRNVVRSRLDLVVSLGGTAGLFLGASIISTVELLVFIFIRVCNKTKKIPKPKSNGSERKNLRFAKKYIKNQPLPYSTENMVFVYRHPENERALWKLRKFNN